MSRKFNILAIISLTIVAQGCVSLKFKEAPRVDLDIHGNAGYVVGDPIIEDAGPTDPTRSVVDKVAVDVLGPVKAVGKAVEEADTWTKEYLW